MWSKMTSVATADTPLHRGKRHVSAFYFSHLLPRIKGLNESICQDHAAIMALDEEDF
jgi:hypothetical protein